MKSLLSIWMVFVAMAGMAKAAEPQRNATNSQAEAAEADDRKSWQTDLSELFHHLQGIARKGSTPERQYFVDGILRGTDSWAIPVLHPYAQYGEVKFLNGYADLTPKSGTVQWIVNEALKDRSIEWEFEVARAQVINVGESGSDRDSEQKLLELVPRYDDGGDQFNLKIPVTRISTIRVEIPTDAPTLPELIAGDRVRVEGTIGDYATNRGVQLNNFTGPIVVYKRQVNEVLLQTTISIGLRNATVTPKRSLPSFNFRKLASVPTRNQDEFTHARVAVSLEQKAVISRNYLVSRGEDVRDRIGAYLWSLDPDDPKRTKLPDSTTFGFVPNSNLAYQVHWGSGVRFWDTRTHTRSGDYIPHELREDTIIGPAVSPSGRLMVTRSQLNHLRFWDLSTRQPITPEMKQRGNVYGMKFSPDGKCFFSSTGRYLTIWQPETGKLVAGPLRHDIYSYVYSPETNRIVTFENNDEREVDWTSRLIIRSGESFTEVDRAKLVGRAREAGWIDDQHLLVVADNRDPGEQGPFTYRKRLVYLVTLASDEPQIRELMRHDWIRGSHIAPDREHFIIRTRDETSCWKVGDREPIWTKSGDHLVSFGDRDWVLFHNGPLIAYSLADGRKLWQKKDVGICRVFGANVWTCNKNEMEIWRVEPRSKR